MGKKSRLKKEAAAARAVVAPVVPVVAIPVMTEAEALLAMSEEVIEQRKHLRLLELNDEPFSHPENAARLDTTFVPMQRWLYEQRRKGVSDALPNGVVIMQPNPGDEWYPVGDAFIAVADTYELIANDLGIPDEGGALRQIGRRLNVSMPLDEFVVDAALKALAWMRQITLPFTPTTYHKYLVAIQTRALFREQGIL